MIVLVKMSITNDLKLLEFFKLIFLKYINTFNDWWNRQLIETQINFMFLQIPLLNQSYS